MSQYSLQHIQLEYSSSVQRMLEVVPPQDHPIMTQQFMHVYRTALGYSEMDLDLSLKFRNVKIYENDYIHEVYSVGNSTLPHLVLLHGYGGTSLTFAKLFKPLSTRYQIHALDTFGVGLSSRGNWHNKMTREEVVNYYIDAIEAWREKVGIQQFVLAGHSLGGYIGCLYYQKFSFRVQQIFFISPAGTARWSQKQISTKKQTAGCFMCMGEIIWNCNFQPTKILNYCLFGKYLLNKIVTEKLRLEIQEQHITSEYLRMIVQQKKTSEMGFYILFVWPIQPERCIEMMVRSIKPKIHIDFMYGDKDWMKPAGAKRLEKDFKTVKVHQINGAGHQLLFDDPERVAAIMRDGLKVKLQHK